MRSARLLVLLVAIAALGLAAGDARSDVGAPTGLHGFLLRADEPGSTTFSRTPSFAWNPVPGADHYEFELSLSSTFRDNSVIYADLDLPTPVVAPELTLPWITGNPHSLYARVRAMLPTGATPWSKGFGFDMTPPPPPSPLPTYPGVLRWTPVEGALSYQVWLLDASKIENVTTNVIDEREFYTFHQTAPWISSIRWRVRALRLDNTTGRLNGLNPVQYGAWSPVYATANPSYTAGPLTLVGTTTDVFSNGSPSSPAHRLMPAFLWSGNQTLSGTPVELFRVYVFTDRQCLNRVFTSAVVGSPAYAPRSFGPLALPTTVTSLATARTSLLKDGAEPPGVTFDGESVSPTEAQADATPTTAIPGAPGDSATSTGGGITWSGKTGAPVGLWDTQWPRSGYYWTVVAVAPEVPGGLATTVGASAAAGDTTLTVSGAESFSVGDTIAIGTGPTAENATVTGAAGGKLTLAAKLAFGHGVGELVSRTSGSLQYQDLELPQDVCAAGRVQRFGKASEPALTSSGGVFATGLSATGRLTSAVRTTAFYGQPLVSWTPALGADAYEVQWSKTRYPFTPEIDPRTSAKGYMTGSTSLVLPVGPGTWFYRVRGFDYSLPTGAQQMSWSAAAKLVVAKPKLKVVPGTKRVFKPTK